MNEVNDRLDAKKILHVYYIPVSSDPVPTPQGVTVFDTSISGLGGCPYAPGASGNVATEDVVYMLKGMGVGIGTDLDSLLDASLYISKRLERPPQSKVARALLAKRNENKT